jgi:MFS family permease
MSIKHVATRWHLVLILWVSGILAAMQFSKVSFAFQALQTHYAASASTMGWILSTVGMVGLVFGAVAGLCAPAIGYRRLLLVGMGLGALLALMQSLMPPLLVLWFTRLLEGVSQLAVVVAAPTLIIQYTEPRHRSITMGLWSTFVSVAFVLTSAGGGWLLQRFHLAGLLLAHSVGMAVMFLLVWVTVPEDHASRPPWPAWSKLPSLHFQLYGHWSTALPGLCFFCYTCCTIAMFTFLPQYAGQSSQWLAPVLPMLTIVGTFSAGWLAKSLMKPDRLVRLAFGGVALAGLYLGFSLMTGGNLVAAAIMLMFMLGVAAGSSFALVPYLNDTTMAQARATGAVAQLGNLGSTLGTPLVTVCISLMGRPGLALPAILFAALGCSMAIIGTRVPRDRSCA